MRRLALAMLLLSCNTALRDAMQRAEAAHLRGDFFGEAVALRDACRADPGEREICRAAQETSGDIIAKQLQTAAGPCDSEPNACLAVLEVLAPFADASDPRLTPYFDRAGAMLAERCGRAPLESPEDAVFVVRCAEAFRQRVPTRGYAARIAEVRQRAGAWASQTASARSATPGVAWLYASLAGCLGGQSAYGPGAQAFRAAFDDAHALRLQLRGQTPFDARTLCEHLRSSSSAVLRCDGRAGATLAVDLDAWLEPMRDAPVREVRSVDVLDHTERWENPDYRHAQSEARTARRTWDNSSRQARLAASDCETAEAALSRAKYCSNCYARSLQEQTCNRKSALQDIERRSKRELDDAERRLSSTPSYLTRDVYRTVSYRVVEHRFAVPWRLRIAVGGAAAVERAGALSFEATEREGVPAANISYLPYSEPSEAQRHEGLGQIVLEQGSAVLRAELDRRAQARLAVCPAPNEWSDCQVEATLLKGEDPVAQFIEDVGTKLDARPPRPWPKAPCAP